MADDPLALETEMREIAEQIKKRQKELGELERSDMDKNSPLQDKISRLIEKHKLLRDRWEKARIGGNIGR